MNIPKREVQSGGGLFLVLKDGESINGVFRGEIHEHFIKWVNNKSVPVGHEDPEGKVRFKVNFVTYRDNKFQALIWDFPQTVYNLMADINIEYPLETTKVKISRRGTGTDTEYSILPLLAEKVKLTQALINQIGSIALNVLDTKPTTPQPQSNGWDANEPGPSHFNDDEELPF